MNKRRRYKAHRRRAEARASRRRSAALREYVRGYRWLVPKFMHRDVFGDLL